MAKPHIEEEVSPFYPPRAGWWSHFLAPLFKLRRRLNLDKIKLPGLFRDGQILLGLILPGYAFFAAGRRTWGWAFVGVYVFSALLVIVALGLPIASLGYGLMISAHASSIVFMQGRWLRAQCRLPLRLALALVTLLLVWWAVYSPVTSFVEGHLFLPLRMRGDVVIVQRLANPAEIRPGDWIAWEREGGNAHRETQTLQWRGGVCCGRVLAAAGDTVLFSTNSIFVNGVGHPRQPLMPVRGEFVVPQNHWFVWPELAITQGNVSDDFLADVMRQLATVPGAQLVGKPFKHWFWRKQQFHEPVRQS